MKTSCKITCIFLLYSLIFNSVFSQNIDKTWTLNATPPSGEYTARDWIALTQGFNYSGFSPIPAETKIVILTWNYSPYGTDWRPFITLNSQTVYGTYMSNPPSIYALNSTVQNLASNLSNTFGSGWTFSTDYNYTAQTVWLIIENLSDYSVFGNENSSVIDQYYYAGDAGTFKASINEELLFGLDYQEEQSGTSRDLDYTLPVGSSVGVFDVSSTGAANYTMPIEAPPGTAEIQPQLAITYSSQSGNGLLGLGWNISGFSSITRSGKNHYYDSNADDIDFDSGTNGDRFELDGNRLVLISGTYGSNGSVYYTSNEVFSRVTAYGTAGAGPQWFQVETKDGYIIEYGNTADSRIEAQGRTDVIIWNVNKIYDHRGNYMKFYYNEFNSTGEYYPKEIEYTGNTNTGLTPYNKVKFFYATKDDPSKAYIHGSAVQQSVLLYKIKTYADNTLSHAYEFKYSQDSYSHLNEILEYGSDNTRYNSIIINWGGPTNSFSSASSFDNGQTNKFYFGDFNGDGKEDFVRTRNKTTFTSDDKWELYLNQNGTTFELSDEDNLSDVFVSFRGTDYFYRKNLAMRPIDFNSDGLDDIVFVEYHVGLTGEYEYSYDYMVYISDGQHLIHDPNLSLHYNDENPIVIFGDFNGDGKTDLHPIFESDLLYTYEIYPIDFNGDGKTDIMGIYNNDCIIYDGNSTTELYHSGFPTEWHRVFPGDFNGDGKTDMLTWSTAGWQITYSKGDGFVWPQLTVPIINNVDPDLNDLNHNYYIGDYNGDGKSDIFEVDYNSPDENYFFNVYYSNGSNFFRESYIQDVSNYLDISHFNFGDFNGDGKQECLLKAGLNPGIMIRMHPNEKKDLVHSFTDGYNVTTSIAYKPLTDNSVYIKGSGAAFPVCDFKEALHVVSSVNTIDGIGGIRTINYTYEGAKLHLQGRGLLGFLKTTSAVENISITINEYELFSNASYSTMLLKKQSLKNRSGLDISETINTNLIKDFGNKRIFPYLSSALTNDILRDISTTTTYTYNPADLTYGNLSSISINYDDDVIETTSNTYVTAGSWCPEKISSNTITKLRTGEGVPYARITNFNYNSSTGLLESTTTDPGAGKSVTSSFLYDSYGNLGEIEVTAVGIEDRVTEMLYDDKGRFVIQKTNALDHPEVFTYDDLYGNVVTTNDANGNRIEYRYDGFGALKTFILPGGRYNHTSMGWVTDNNPPNARYYILTSGSGTPSSKIYYDALGRELKSEVTGFGGEIIYSEKEYWSYGLPKRVSAPYKNGGTILWTTNNYDIYRRKSLIVSPSCSTSYSYSGTTVTTTDCNSHSSSKTYNGAGDIVTATDNIGGSVSYYYHPSGQVREINAAGTVITMTYDDFGMQTSLTDLNTGTTSYTYNALGELLTQTNARNQTTTLTYDLLGRVLTKNNPEGTVTYIYDNATKGIGLITSASKTNHSVSYTYDELSRLKTETNIVEGTSFITSYEYDNSSGNIAKVFYPSQFSVINEYDSCGYLQRVKRGDNNALIWQGNSVNQYGQVTGATLGNNLTVTHEYDQYGFPTIWQTGSVQDMQFNFNTARGNLEWRKDNLSSRMFTENFMYDNLDRLTNSQIGTNNYSTTYLNNGNIDIKYDAGTYAYESSRPHAVTGLTGSPMTAQEQVITYNSFNQPVYLTEGVESLTITYGVDEQRIKSNYIMQSINWTRKYLGDYEEVWVSSQLNKKIHYISGGDGLAAVYIINGAGVGEMYYVSTDYLGNILLLTRQNGSLAEEYSFDAWGRRRSPTNWNDYWVPMPSILYRGYTGHEHLDEFSLINMNGRCYDPLLGRFLSPDNFVQMPDFTQNYNRYTYCLNNPLIYTDPSGEFFHLIIGAVVGAIGNWAVNGAEFTLKGLGYFGVGAIAGALGAGVGAGLSSMLPVSGSLSGGFAAGFMGTSAATTATTSFASGALIGGGAGFGSGFVGGFGNGLLEGQKFGDALESGIKYGFISGLSGMAISGITNGIKAMRDDRRFWDGATVNDYRLRDHNIPYVPQNTEYNCGPASAEAVTNHQLNQNSVRTALGGDPNRQGIADVRIMQHIQNNTGRAIPPAQYGGVDAIYDAMTNQGNVVLSLSGNPGHMVVANAVWERTVTKISGSVFKKLFLEVMNPASGQYIRQSIGKHQRFFTILF